MTLGDRIVVMRSGRILQMGTPMEVYDRPATSFVAGFVGNPRMNFIDGILDTGAQRSVVRLFGAAIDLRRAADGAPAAPARPVLVGIRPEDIAVAAPDDADIVARLDVVEPLGKEVLLHLLAEDPPASAPVDLRVLTPPGGDLRPDAKVGLRFHRDRIHLFDPSTEARIPPA